MYWYASVVNRRGLLISILGKLWLKSRELELLASEHLRGHLADRIVNDEAIGVPLTAINGARPEATVIDPLARMRCRRLQVGAAAAHRAVVRDLTVDHVFLWLGIAFVRHGCLLVLVNVERTASMAAFGDGDSARQVDLGLGWTSGESGT